MTNTVDTQLATASGTVELGGDLPVYRLGFGAMRIPGKGIWGEPAKPTEGRAVLRRSLELGGNVSDTADAYAAQGIVPIVSVQNRYNLTDREHEDVLDACERAGIGFIPWFPLATGDLAKPGSRLDQIAQAHDAAPAQIALAWLLKRSPVMLPIPGTSSVAHLEENMAAARIELSDDEFKEIDALAK